MSTERCGVPRRQKGCGQPPASKGSRPQVWTLRRVYLNGASPEMVTIPACLSMGVARLVIDLLPERSAGQGSGVFPT
jgi:hypothetical protein